MLLSHLILTDFLHFSTLIVFLICFCLLCGHKASSMPSRHPDRNTSMRRQTQSLGPLDLKPALKRTLKFSLGLALLTFNACSEKQAQQSTEATAPEAVVKQAIKASMDGDFAQVYALASHADKSKKSETEYVQERKQQGQTSAKQSVDLLKKRTRIKVIDLKVQGDQATGTLRMMTPDLEAIFKEVGTLDGDKLKMLGMPAPEAGAKPDQSRLLVAIFDTYYPEGKGMPVVPVDTPFKMVKEPAGWRIVNGW
jgi:hypothetical protein